MGLSVLRMVAVAAVTVGFVVDVHGGWGSWGGSHGGYASVGNPWGSSGSHGSWGGCTGYVSEASWGCGGGSCAGGWYGRPGLVGRLHGHLAAHRARRLARRVSYASGGCWGGSSGSYASFGCGGGWGCSGAGSTGYGCCGGYVSTSYGCCGGYASSGWAGGSVGGSAGSWSYDVVDECETCGTDGAMVPAGEGTVIEQGMTPVPQPAAEPSPADQPSARASDRGVLTVSVPVDARVFVNGSATRSQGGDRRYVSNGLSQGYSYRYEVRAVVERDGQMLEQTRVATLRGGRITHLDFDFAQRQAVETRLTLHVPQDAKVRLSGNETRATGAVRHFATQRLQPGEKWAEYVVDVSVEREGRVLTKQQRVSLSGGDQKELSFRFDETELADAR